MEEDEPCPEEPSPAPDEQAVIEGLVDELRCLSLGGWLPRRCYTNPG